MEGDAVITVKVEASDPLTAVGTAEVLRAFPGVQVLTVPENGVVADVVVVLVDDVDDDALAAIRQARTVNNRPVVLVSIALTEESVLTAVEAGARAILRRRDATPDRLADLVRGAVRGEGSVPTDVLGRLLEHVGRLQSQVLLPLGIHLNGLTDREVQVLRLVSEGLETAEIAERLHYSQRTIKGVLHDVTCRLNLKNRTHAVAYAVREGLI